MTKQIICDLWGVIHDGIKPYDGVIDKIKEFNQKGYELIFLSNAPRRAVKVEEKLNAFDIDKSLYRKVITSGDIFFNEVTSNYKSPKIFYIGPEKDLDILDDFQEAQILPQDKEGHDFALLTGFRDKNETIEEKIPELNIALKKGLKLYCINPDLAITRQDGSIELCAGTLAREYEKLGGEVQYFGKPYEAVYNYTMKYFTNSKDKNNTYMVGDSFNTDIRGACNFGIKAVLCECGLYRDDIKKNGIEAIEKRYNLKVDISCKSLATLEL